MCSQARAKAPSLPALPAFEATAVTAQTVDATAVEGPATVAVFTPAKHGARGAVFVEEVQAPALAVTPAVAPHFPPAHFGPALQRVGSARSTDNGFVSEATVLVIEGATFDVTVRQVMEEAPVNDFQQSVSAPISARAIGAVQAVGTLVFGLHFTTEPTGTPAAPEGAKNTGAIGRAPLPATTGEEGRA